MNIVLKKNVENVNYNDDIKKDDIKKDDIKKEVINEHAIASLTHKEKKELKNLYRRARRLCHPDLLSEQLVFLGTEIFKELQLAYESNNLFKVKEIYNMLSGNKSQNAN